MALMMQRPCSLAMMHNWDSCVSVNSCKFMHLAPPGGGLTEACPKAGGWPQPCTPFQGVCLCGKGSPAQRKELLCSRHGGRSHSHAHMQCTCNPRCACSRPIYPNRVPPLIIMHSVPTPSNAKRPRPATWEGVLWRRLRPIGCNDLARCRVPCHSTSSSPSCQNARPSLNHSRSTCRVHCVLWGGRSRGHTLTRHDQTACIGTGACIWHAPVPMLPSPGSSRPYYYVCATARQARCTARFTCSS